MPYVHQVLNLVDLVPSTRQVEFIDEATLKTEAYETDYGFVKLRAEFGRGLEDELVTITFSVVA